MRTALTYPVEADYLAAVTVAVAIGRTMVVVGIEGNHPRLVCCRFRQRPSRRARARHSGLALVVAVDAAAVADAAVVDAAGSADRGDAPGTSPLVHLLVFGASYRLPRCPDLDHHQIRWQISSQLVFFLAWAPRPSLSIQHADEGVFSSFRPSPLVRRMNP